MNPMFKWSGGKRDEIEKFKRFYPENFDTFVEPFFGAGAVYFDLEFKGENVINDIHPESVNFFNQIKNGNMDKLYDLMNNAKNEEDYYYFIRGITSDKKNNKSVFELNTDIDKAFRFFYLRKTAYRGMLRYNKDGEFNIPFGRYKTFNYEELKNKKYEELLKNTKIYNEDFSVIMDKYNNENSFIFLDPPYDSEFTDYGYCKFDRDDQKRLFESFKNSKAKCLMIIASTPFINELYEDYIYGSYSKKYAFKIHSGRVGEEIDKEHLIIKNYRKD